MKNSPERFQILQIVCQIALSIGTSLDLRQMLNTSLVTFLKALNCTAGVVYYLTSNTEKQFSFEPIYFLSQNVTQSETDDLIRQYLPPAFNEIELTNFGKQLPLAGNMESGHYFYIFELPNFGLLVLVKDDGTLSSVILKSLKPLLLKLAVACQACLMTDKFASQKMKLAQAREAAEVAERAKHEFLANMSHELRTPLNGILGYVQILKQDKNFNPRQKDGLAVIHQSGEHLLTIINDILEFAKIDQQQIELQLADVRLPYFLQNIASIYQLQTDQKGLAFSYETLTPLSTNVRADERRLRQILINLLGNAIKFTDKGKVIFRVTGLGSQRVKYSHERPRSLPPSVVRFEIIDTGIGISASQLERMFVPFEQRGEFRNYSDGLGLGLAISQRLIKLMGGELQVKSELGKGSTFWFDLELPPLGEQSDEIKEVHERTITGYKGTPKKLLLIDEPANRATIIKLLEPLGFEVVEADDDIDGVRKAWMEQPDVVFLQLMPPMQTSIEAMKKIRQTVKSKQTVVIALSDSLLDVSQTQDVLTGFDEWLSKPIEPKKLLDLLQTYLELEWIYLEWSYKVIDESELAKTETMVLPPQQYIDILVELAIMGDLITVEKQLNYIEQLDEKYIPFVRQVSKLAKDFEDEKILTLIEQYMGGRK